MDIKEFLAAKGLPEELAPRFEKLTELALGWNEKINITAIKDPAEFMEKNVIDSLTLCGAPQLDAAVHVLDLGTGGGYPGLPLAMAYPEKSFVLVDSVGKKLKVIDAICGELEIANVSTVHARAEELAFNKEYREKFDLVTSRAVAALPVLCVSFERTDISRLIRPDLRLRKSRMPAGLSIYWGEPYRRPLQMVSREADTCSYS